MPKEPARLETTTLGLSRGLAILSIIVVLLGSVYLVAKWPPRRPRSLEGRVNAAASIEDLSGVALQERNDDPGEMRRIQAPELDGGVAWLNTAGPLKLRDLHGKIVLLDFWTLCCINCIHTLPDLAKLEKKYANQLVVVGVHSAKFDSEKNSESIRKAILR